MPVALVVPFVALLAGAFVMLSYKGWEASFARLLEWLAEHTRISVDVGWPVGRIEYGGISRAFTRANKWIQARLGETVAYTMLPVVLLLRGLANAFHYPAAALEGLARDVYNTLAQLRSVVIPAQIAAKVGWIPRRLAALTAGLAHAVTREVFAPIKAKALAAYHATTVTLPHTIARVDHWIGRTARQARAHARRLSRLEQLVTGAAFVALVAHALRRMRLGWLRCSRVNKVGRAVCGLNNGVVDFLLGTTTLLLALDNLCALVKAMQAAGRKFEPVLIGFINEIEGHICGKVGDEPSGIVPSDWQRVSRLPSAV